MMDTSLRVRRQHKSWPEALKREIVAASLVPGVSVSVVARKYDVNTNQVFSWRKRFGPVSGAGVPQLVPLVVMPDPPAAAPVALSADLIEIELPRGYRLRIGTTSKRRHCVLCWMRWNGDDRIPIECARVAGGRTN
jgi:transposase-like protein